MVTFVLASVVIVIVVSGGQKGWQQLSRKGRWRGDGLRLRPGLSLHFQLLGMKLLQERLLGLELLFAARKSGECRVLRSGGRGQRNRHGLESFVMASQRPSA